MVAPNDTMQIAIQYAFVMTTHAILLCVLHPVKLLSSACNLKVENTALTSDCLQRVHCKFRLGGYKPNMAAGEKGREVKAGTK